MVSLGSVTWLLPCHTVSIVQPPVKEARVISLWWGEAWGWDMSA